MNLDSLTSNLSLLWWIGVGAGGALAISVIALFVGMYREGIGRPEEAVAPEKEERNGDRIMAGLSEWATGFYESRGANSVNLSRDIFSFTCELVRAGRFDTQIYRVLKGTDWGEAASGWDDAYFEALVKDARALEAIVTSQIAGSSAPREGPASRRRMFWRFVPALRGVAILSLVAMLTTYYFVVRRAGILETDLLRTFEREESHEDSSDVVRDLYQDAMGRYREGAYEAALLRFQGVLGYENPHVLKDNALYWIGECLYGMGRYRKAMEVFQEVEKRFPSSNKVPDARIMRALCLAKLGESERAIRLLETLLAGKRRGIPAERIELLLRRIRQGSSSFP